MPGQVKTRLCPPLTSEQAAALAAAALTDTVETLTSTPASAHSIAFQGDPGPWLPAGLKVLPQRGNGLDERLAAAFDDAWAAAPCPTLLIGMDTPQVDTDLLAAAGRRLLSPGVDAVLGHAADGGFWALGLHRPDPNLLLGVPMSTAFTGTHQLARLNQAGLRVAELPTLADVDTVDDATAVATTAPHTHFAAALATLTRTTPETTVTGAEGGRSDRGGALWTPMS